MLLLLSRGSVFASPYEASSGENIPSDMPYGWSHDAVSAAVFNGLLVGDENGLLHPCDAMKGCELAAFMERAFGSGEKADLSGYKDVSPGDWYFDSMSSAVGAGWIRGDGDGHLMPLKPVSRVRYFVIMARALDLPDGDIAALTSYPDGGEIPVWAQGAVAAMLENGFIHGTDKGIEPDVPVSREEVCQVFYNTFDTYINEPGVYFGLTGSVLVSVNGVTIKDSKLDILCVGSGVTENVELVNTESKTVLGNSEAAETVPAGANPGAVSGASDDSGSDDLPDPQTVLRSAIAHFNANKDNYTAQVASVQDMGFVSLAVGYQHCLDGDLEKTQRTENGAVTLTEVTDWSAGKTATLIDDAYWFETDSADTVLHTMHGFTMSMDTDWFTEANGVYTTTEEHLSEALETVLGPLANESYRDVAFSLTVSDGVIAAIHAEREYTSVYVTTAYIYDYTFSGYGESALMYPDTFELCNSSDIYGEPEHFLSGDRFIVQTTVLYARGGDVFAATTNWNRECQDAIPVVGDEAVLNSLEEGKACYLLATVREKEDGGVFFPYELAAEKAWGRIATTGEFTDFESLSELAQKLTNGPLPVNLLGVTAAVSDGACVLTDADGYTATIPAGELSDETLAELDGRGVNMNTLFAVEGENGEILVTVAPTSTRLRAPCRPTCRRARQRARSSSDT